MVDIPLIKEKNDLRLDAGLEGLASFHSTVSYGATKFIAIQLYGDFALDYILGAEEGYQNQRFYIQGSTGLFHKIGEHSVIELYGGAGHGEMDDKQHSLNGTYNVGFGQINYGRCLFLGRDNSRRAQMEYGIGLKIGNILSDNKLNKYEMTYYFNDKGVLFEPILMIRFGGERFKTSLRLAGCKIWNYYSANSYYSMPYSFFNFGIGFNVNL